ncbi:MAG: HPP family protein [Nitrospirae bacterium]|nr:HPP family protein [Nitrospirota bacterium]
MDSTPPSPSPVVKFLTAALPALGAFVAILGAALITRSVIGGPVLPLVVASMGASAVLLFCAAESPLAAWWPFFGGHICSVLVGVAAARWVPDMALASAVAVGGAIVAMRLLGCMHPPGGAAALTAVVGGPAVAKAGFYFLLVPVGINMVALALLVLLFRRAEAALGARTLRRC